MNWTSPTEYEHGELVRFIRNIRRGDVAFAVVLFILFLIPIAIGIWMLTDHNMLGLAPLISFSILMLVPMGCLISDLDRKKLILDGDYSVCRCRVASRNAVRSGRTKVTYFISVRLDDGSIRKFKTRSDEYSKAKEGEKALVVLYKKTEDLKKELPPDVVILREI